MADTNKKEYTSNLHPKGDMDTTVYPNVKSENIIDKDTTAYTAGKVPDSSLVQKSLDSLSENLETTKIQVGTNKTNIATLQVDVAGLKQDNQTTKTTIAGLVSDNTQNKQDISTNTQNIENLSAVTPTDINVDSDFNLVLEHDGKVITGQKKLVKSFKYAENGDFVYDKNIYIYNSSSGKFKEFKYIFDSYGHRDDNGGFHYFENEQYSDIYYSGFNIYIKSASINSPYSLGFLITKNVRKDTCIFSIKYTSQDDSNVRRTLNLPTKSGTIARIEDLETKQDKRFVHTVEIHYGANGSYFCFTGTSDKNTPIGSVQDLITVFANRDLCGVGVFGSAGLSKIHVGSSVNDTTFKKYMNNGEYTNPSEETFAMVFNTTGFTITDSVSAL